MPRKKYSPQKRKNEGCLDLPSRARKRRRSRKSTKFKDPNEGIKLPVQFSTTEYPYRLGNIKVTYNSEEENLTPEFLIEFKPECCYFLLEKTEDESEVQKKVLQATCETPFDILQYLSFLNIFHFVVNSQTLQTGENVIKVCLNSSTFISLKYASEPFFNHQRSQMYRVLQYFLNIEFDEYEEDYLYDEEQVAKIYNCISNSYDPKLTECSITHQFLIPKLRAYQCQAVSWMLKCENENSFNTSEDLHELYTAITLPDGHTIYFHKYGGFFVNKKFSPEIPCKGGILADEMGLGKTLEVLACILLNPRTCMEIQNTQVHPSEPVKNSVLSNKNQNFKLGKKRKPSNHYGERDEEFFYDDFMEVIDHFGCVCGSERNEFENRRYKPSVMCIKCNVVQHADCVLYKSDIPEEEYICPFCWVDNTDLLPSRATLIISPASIIYQWEQEILKHVNKSCLKVFMYLGVENQKFVHPTILANHDIVLVSYETLRRELTHVDVPYGSAGHSLRYPKKFITIPSPMCCVQWWRVCLDEAQMVESVSSKIAKMAGKLICVNRWCVTGTPIKKSVEDLYGLFLFLDIHPYQNKMWWKEVIWKPFVNGNLEPLSSALKRIAWGTMKHQVLDQMGVPELTEVTHELEFSPIERIYYLKQHSLCKRDFMEKINKFDDLDIKLCSLDRHVLSKIMFPLRRLQLVCCHFQITRENMEVQKLSKMTKEELLAHLLKTTKYECEDVHRKLIMAMNGLAGIYVIRKDFANAIETFEKVLHSIEDNKVNIRTDVTQHIHAAYHLSEILSVSGKDEIKVNSKFTSLELNTKVKELSQTYIEKHKITLDDCTKNIDEIDGEVSQIMNKFQLKRVEFPVSAWWSAILENISTSKREAFLEKLEDLLENAPGKSYLRSEIPNAKSFSAISFPGFISKMLDMSKDLHDTRCKLKTKISEISCEPTISTLNDAISCHLRPTSKSPKCEYCKAEEIFQMYETKLFRFDETKVTNTEEETICFQNSRRGSHADSDLEIILKFLLNYIRRTCKGSSASPEKLDRVTKCAEDGANELKLIDALKKEFKVLRNVWKKCFDYVSQKDEVEMAKIASRVLLPGETPPNPPVSYILLPHEVQMKQVQYHSDIIAHQFDLRKKLGQLFYLQNLEKAENNNAPFEESCPICQQIFESSWSVLQCGHSLCLLCIEQLLSTKRNFTNSLGFICQGIRCPLCREFTAASDVYFIENNKKEQEEEEGIPIKGFYSTKTNAVVKCLLQISKEDPEAKSLVFSSFTYFLYIIENALKENDIKFFNFCKRKHFQEELEQFKQSKDINTLLIPLNFGCNGLNITEATNVLLLEPVLDNSKHLQAIGRVHRIGQKKTATIHRFVISKTIEESIYDVMKKSSTEEKNKQADLTLQSLKDIFKDT